MAGTSERDMDPGFQRAVSAADVEKALAGIAFPKSRDELVDYVASRIPAESDVLKEIRKLPERTYRTASDVAQGFGELRTEEKAEERAR